MKRESYISSSQHMPQTEKMFHYTCEECGKGTVIPMEFKGYKTRIKGYPFVVDQAIIGVCENCGARHFSARETKRWEELFNKKLEENHIIFTPDQIEQLRKSLRLSVEDFALLIGCTRQSIYNWERKSRIKPQSRMADLLMKLVDQSLKVGEVNVIQCLVDKAKELGISIDVDIEAQISKRVRK
ncbi:MAG TPA: helix-turn-helix domain-containing protein [Syntrophaceae bacterium]|nr:helix-turn-helix domain-containing protein [Syntrophaceae bacterium]